MPFGQTKQRGEFLDQRQPPGERFGQIYVGSGTSCKDKGTWLISLAQRLPVNVPLPSSS